MANGLGVIRKHVSLIHVFADMTNLQRKIINALISESTDDKLIDFNPASECREFVCSVSSLMKKSGYTSNNTQHFKQSLDTLADLKVKWNILKDKLPADVSFLNLRLLHGSPTFKTDGTVFYSFHKSLFSLINATDIYGTIDIDIQSKFDSKFSHALYENSTRFLNMRKGRVIQLDAFRELLSVGGDKYLSMKELTRNVINPSIEEVNDRCQFIVKLEKLKVGRKVAAINLNVEKKKTSLNSCFPKEKIKREVTTEILEKFPDIGENLLANILSQYEDSYIKEKIDYTVAMKPVSINGSFPTPYFLSALKNDYKSQKVVTERPPVPPKRHVRSAEGEWNDERRRIISEINHWESMLEIQRNQSTPEPLLEATKNRIEKYQEALKKHYANRPPVVGGVMT